MCLGVWCRGRSRAGSRRGCWSGIGRSRGGSRRRVPRLLRSFGSLLSRFLNRRQRFCFLLGFDLNSVNFAFHGLDTGLDPKHSLHVVVKIFLVQVAI